VTPIFNSRFYWICQVHDNDLVYTVVASNRCQGPSSSYGSWIYNYMCNQCLSPLKLWVRTLFMARCTRYNIMWKKFVSDLRQVGGFLRVLQIPPPIKLTATI